MICKHGIHMDNACGACEPPRGSTIRRNDDEAFRQYQRDRIAEAQRYDREVGMCLTCAANHYCPKHNPAPAGVPGLDGSKP